MKNIKSRIDRIETALTEASRYHWWQNNSVLIELHDFLSAHNIAVSDSEFESLTGLKPLGNSDQDRAQAEQVFIDFAIKESEKAGVTIDELEQYFYQTDEGQVMTPSNPLEWERYNVTLRQLKLVDGTHLPKRENLFLWYGCVCHRWQIERQKKYN